MCIRHGKRALLGLSFLALSASIAEADDKGTPIAWKKTVIEGKFRSEGVAVADVNKDGKPDILIGDSWYEAPSWVKHDIREPGDYGDGLHSYSKCMTCWSDDVNGDGWPDEIVIGFPGVPALWYENPKGKEGYWPEHEIWHSACNETPLYTDLFGDRHRVLLMGWQPKDKATGKVKQNEGQMAWFTPGERPEPIVGDARYQRAERARQTAHSRHRPILSRSWHRRPEWRRPPGRDLHRRLVGTTRVGPQ